MNYPRRRVFFRMWEWVLLTLLCLVLIYVFAPQQLSVVMYKVFLVSLGACMTYWIDRSLFQRAKDRCDAADMLTVQTDYTEVARHSANVLRRALIFVGVVLGLSLGI